MLEIPIPGLSSASRVRIGVHRDTIWDWVDGRNCLVVSDENVSRLYAAFFACRTVFLIPPGEKGKAPIYLLRLLKAMAVAGLDRSSCLLAVGGGVVSDLAVLASGLYMRGIPAAVVSSTLLGQVDASVGGKCAVNMMGVKNLIGLFRQPELVLCDISMLETLPEREWRSGLGELLKYALLSGRQDCDLLRSRRESFAKRRRDELEALIAASIRYKVKIVGADEHETGLRRILNLGHSFGHVYEAQCGLAHGEAVILGLIMALRCSYRLGLMKKEDRDMGLELIKSLGGPLQFPALSQDQIRFHLGLDKKKMRNDIALVLLEAPGRPVLKMVAIEEVVDAWPALCLDF